MTYNNISISRIPNELLKNGSFKLKQFLLVILNQILEDGIVPQALNIGKCILIYKVTTNRTHSTSHHYH